MNRHHTSIIVNIVPDLRLIVASIDYVVNYVFLMVENYSL